MTAMPTWWSEEHTIDALIAPLIGLSLDEVEYRLHSADLQTRLRRMGDTDFGPPDGYCPTRINLVATRQGKVVSYTVG